MQTLLRRTSPRSYVGFAKNQPRLIVFLKPNHHHTTFAHNNFLNGTSLFHSAVQTLKNDDNVVSIPQNANSGGSGGNLLSFHREQLKLAYDLYTQSHFLESYKIFVDAIEAFEQFFSSLKTDDKNGQINKEDGHLLAIGYNNLAENLRYMLKSGYHSPSHPKYSFATITKLYNRAEEIWSKWPNDDEVDYWRGTLFNNMGLYYMESARNHPNALVQFLKASEIRKKLLDRITDPNHVSNAAIDLMELRTHLAVTFNNIGQCHVNMRQTKQAMSFFENAKHLFEQQASESGSYINRIYVVVLNNIGLTFFEMNKYDDALTHFFKALSVLNKNTSTEAASEQNPLSSSDLERLLEEGCGEELGVTLNNIGTIFYMKAKFDQAENYLRMSLKVFHRVLAPNHKHIATTSTQLAVTLREKHSKAPKPSKELLKSSASAVLSKMGWNPFGNKKEQAEPAELTQEQMDFKESKELLEKARSIASIHQAELDALTKQKQEEQRKKEQEIKKFQGSSLFSRYMGQKRSKPNK